MHPTLPLLEPTDFPQIARRKLETLQVNLGYKCNQSCVHCHVNAGPTRTEQMDLATVHDVIAFLAASDVQTLDVTGGAPELNPYFRELVTRARALGVRVMDRCNLTVLEHAGQEDLAGFLAAHHVEVTASLPCYSEQNVDRQRGGGVFAASIRGLQKLNALGYGVADAGLLLNLVYNPQGPVLPPDQHKLEADYRKHLHDEFGISFNHLYVLTNMPIQRFGSMLISKGQFYEYLSLLKSAYQQDNLGAVMCRSLLSVDWRGYTYDCDFNQMLDLPFAWKGQPRPHLSELIGSDVTGNRITVKDHCYGCTAGQGSCCGGALA
jgi:radical SAM/Cys-rich protein